MTLNITKTPLRQFSAIQIFKLYGNYIHAIILKMVHDPEITEDIYQEFFLSLMARPLTCPEPELKRYLYRSVNHEVIDALRRRNRYHQAVQRYRHHRNYSHTNQALFQREKEDIPATIDAVLQFMKDNLPQCQSEAIISRYQHQNGIEQTARIMGVTKKTVIKYISDGLKIIREGLLHKGKCLDETIC